MRVIGFKELRNKLGGDSAPCRRTIERMIKDGEFIAPVLLSSKRIGFIEAEVDAWIASRKKPGETAA
ncbi:MAG: AlpA family phage regulatory protein [Rhodocyclales bacterium]|nr:AlpA family phage regulatory protein [Rhodocyclales bacterium]